MSSIELTKKTYEQYGLYTGGDLGAQADEGETRFALWSPAARLVRLHLYQDGTKGERVWSAAMRRDQDGVWRARLDGNLHGVYYDYTAIFEGKAFRLADPYARACGLNGKRSMVVDLKRTNPRGWEEDQAPPKRLEQIIYEVHVKEFSWDEAAGFPEETRGKYLAFTRIETTLDRDGLHPTGIGYLKTLGVTHIQLMPVYDFGSVDESGDTSQFNWGYDPVNYNVPEGLYASDAACGEVRIRELKELVMSLHRQGFRVIMDVVYNHTYRADSWLERAVPGYYYRREEDGSLSNGSGCGNDMACERPMCAKYILDSVLYWAREYHMDGFRFDLMGLLPVELMNRIQEELDRLYGKGEKLIYGEPWAANDSPMERGFHPAKKDAVRLLDQNVGVFCDNTRDAVKGHVFEEKEPGFVNGGAGFEEDILRGVTAWCGPDADKRGEHLRDKRGRDAAGQPFRALAPSQIITYVSSHDNQTLWDKLVNTVCPEAGYDEMDERALCANRLAAAICFTSQGRPFLLSGEEFARTKQGMHDSFCAPIRLNRLDYRRAYENEALVEYYRGLMALRQLLPGLCDKSKTAWKRVTEKKIISQGLVSFRVDNREPETERSEWDCAVAGREGADQDGQKAGRAVWQELFIVYHAGKYEKQVALPAGEWEVLVDGRDSFAWKKGNRVSSDEYRMEPISALVLGKSRRCSAALL